MKSVAVFCASGIGNKPDYKDEAYKTGKFLARHQLEVIYGGSHIGLMGALAQGALDHGGVVRGVLPEFMTQHELAHQNLTELIMVDSMQERKLKMHELSDAVIALPGGFGTFEELFEMLTWAQLGLHQKPIGILNVKGYYNHLKKLLDHMTNEGLLKSKNAEMLLFSDTIKDLHQIMQDYKPPKSDLSISEQQT